MPSAAVAGFSSLPSAGKWVVALSGGRDSIALLDMAQLWLRAHPGPLLRAVHVDHGLQPLSADWRRFCEDFCDRHGVPLSVHQIQIGDHSGQGVEAAARRARYQIFEAELGPGDTLLLAHHEDDQVETVLQRLFRGTGPRGIVGMPVERPLGQGRLHRPLLDLSRDALNKWVVDRGLEYVDDPTNADVAYDRGVLRTQVLPVVAERWPGYRDSIKRFSSLQRDLIEGLPDMPVVRSVFGEPLLAVESFDSVEEMATSIHTWLTTLSVISPSQRRLHEFARQCRETRDGGLPRLSLKGGELIAWRSQIFLTSPTVPASAICEEGVVGNDMRGPWGTIVWTAASKRGLRAGEEVQVRYRLPQEKVAPLGGVHKDFGQLCQERGVPPWWRQRLPIITCQGVPVWAPGIGLLGGAELLMDHTGGGRMPHLAAVNHPAPIE